jgi:hypothetical protein
MGVLRSRTSVAVVARFFCRGGGGMQRAQGPGSAGQKRGLEQVSYTS